MSNRKQPAQAPSAPSPSVLDVGRQIVSLADRYQEMDVEQTKLRHHFQELSPAERRRFRHLDYQMKRTYDQEVALVDAALSMQAQTLSDVAVMLRLAFRVLDIEVSSEYDEADFQKAGKQITNALLTSIAVIVKETGLPVAETLGHDVEWFLARDSVGVAEGGVIAQ
jgi:hypothetical protein